MDCGVRVQCTVHTTALGVQNIRVRGRLLGEGYFSCSLRVPLISHQIILTVAEPVTCCLLLLMCTCSLMKVLVRFWSPKGRSLTYRTRCALTCRNCETSQFLVQAPGAAVCLSMQEQEV